MKKTQAQRSALSMAGEFGVASELNKREFLCSVTYGNAKAMDVIVLSKINPNKHAVIEVKTSDTGRFLTMFFQKYYIPTNPHPDFWIFVHIDSNLQSHYYIFTHNEVCNLQMQINNMSTIHQVVGCDNIPLKNLQEGINAWNKLVF